MGLWGKEHGAENLSATSHATYRVSVALVVVVEVEIRAIRVQVVGVVTIVRRRGPPVAV